MKEMGRTCGMYDGENKLIQDFEHGILERDNLEDPGIDK
jgi:hypothetical protein